MDFELHNVGLRAAKDFSCDALVVLVGTGRLTAKDPLSILITQALKSADLETAPGKVLSLFRTPGVSAGRLVLAGVGDGSARQVRKSVLAAVAGLAKLKSVKRVLICSTLALSPQSLQAAVLAVGESTYVYATTKPKAEGRHLESVVLGVPGSDVPVALSTALAQARATLSGIELAKEWANRPANHATPTMLGQAAQALVRFPKVECEVLGPEEVHALGMGSFAAVAKGSQEPLRFVVLRYKGGAAKDAPVVLVGKGITFDTGGISIKPAAEMDEMKFDMCGAASVLGVFQALGELQPAVSVIGIIPSCENMPGPQAVKPGDVVTSMSGQTIEVLNTDAEGRLILCDALTYAERFKPSAVVDIATLTGACVVALGGVRTGMFSSSDELAAQLLDSGEETLDTCWRLPLDEEYGEGLKSNFADMANIAGRAGGAVTAAKFLQKFVGEHAWAHLDIAGTAWKSGAAKGATGRPVALLVEFLTRRAAPVSRKKK
ncbi:MAG: hypothetical protein RLZZ591_1379 [Pseudomonadota bacterium]|jgi:leucyl aminopeptidase